MPQKCLSSNSLDALGPPTADEHIKTRDCRISNMLMKLYSLRIFTAFINTYSPVVFDAQINARMDGKSFVSLEVRKLSSLR